MNNNNDTNNDTNTDNNDDDVADTNHDTNMTENAAPTMTAMRTSFQQQKPSAILCELKEGSAKKGAWKEASARKRREQAEQRVAEKRAEKAAAKRRAPTAHPAGSDAPVEVASCARYGETVPASVDEWRRHFYPERGQKQGSTPLSPERALQDLQEWWEERQVSGDGRREKRETERFRNAKELLRRMAA